MKKLKEKGKTPSSGPKKEDPQEPKEEPTEASRSEKNDALEQEAQTAIHPEEKEDVAPKSPSETTETLAQPAHHRQPSLSLQSKMRSSSFRRTSMSQNPSSPSKNGAKSPILPMLSPDGDSVTEIYRKQAARLDELERENKRLAKEAQDSEGRWRKTEEALEELREARGEFAELKARAGKVDAKNEEIEKLVCEPISFILGSRSYAHDGLDLEDRKKFSPTPELPTTISIIEEPTYLFAQPS